LQQEQEVDLFEWCGLAAQSTTDTRNEVLSLKTKFSEQQEAIDKLNAQLEELIAAKSQHEVVLLEKFRLLLNEKKAKIRDQQRLLATAKVDPEKLEALQASRINNKSRKGGPSRPGKRKAGNSDQQIDEDDEDDGFEKMDLDADKAPDDSDQEMARTPEPEDEETASEDDVDDTPPVKAPARSARQTRANKGKAVAKRDVKGKAGESKSAETAPEEDPPKTPPRRELPFAKKSAPPPKPPIDAADEETASEDDEL
jgi:hypothetical protein